ncbi:MAG: discoidin domain-containing protein [Actinomycetota bacterium]
MRWRVRLLVGLAVLSTTVAPAQISAANGDADGDGIADAIDTVVNTGTNVALDKPASQSSVYAGVTDFFGAHLAVDGDRGGAWPNDRMAITNDAEPWWEVDLGRLHTINGINIHTRTDCCTNRLDGATVSLQRHSGGPSVWSTTIDEAAEVTQLALPTRLGRYVRIELPAHAGMNLQLADVTIMGTPGRPNDTDADLIINTEDTIEHDGDLLTGGTPTQSSTWTGRPNTGPDAARDDNRNGGRDANQPLAITNDDEPWWQLDLDTHAWIDGINIYNRTDGNHHHLNGANVMLAREPFTADMTHAEATAHADWTTTITNPGATIQLDADDTIARHIRIQLPPGAGNHLGLAEVDIIGHTGTGLEGDFTSDTTGGGYWSTYGVGHVFGGWEIVSGSVDTRVDHNSGFSFSVPGQFIDLNGGSAGHIRHDVIIEPGAAYTLTFDLGENSYCGATLKQMEVIWNGTVIDTIDVDIARQTVVATSIELPVTATDIATIEFRSITGSGCGPVLGNPRLTPPETTDPDPDPGPTLDDLVGPTGMEGDFTSDTSIGGGWNTHGAGQTFGDWEVVSGTIDARVSHNSAFAFPVDGQFLDLNGGNAGHIRRSVYVVPGASYTLTFDLAENVYGGPAVKQMEIIWNGAVIETIDVDVAQYTVIPTTVAIPASPTAEGILEFRSTIGGGFGPVLGNPRLTLVAPGE